MSDNGYPFQPAILAPETWADPTTQWDVTAYSDIEVQLTGAITTPYQPMRSLNGTFVACTARDADGVAYATITTPGIYSLDGYGFLKFSAGGGAVVTRRAAA